MRNLQPWKLTDNIFASQQMRLMTALVSRRVYAREKSDIYKKLFDLVGIEYKLKGSGLIDNNFVLKHNGISIKVYFNEAKVAKAFFRNR